MFEPSPIPRVFTVPLGCDFRKAVVQGVLDRMQGTPPEALARVTIYVNSQRSRRKLHEAFSTAARLLPQIRLIGDIAKTPSVAWTPHSTMPPLARKLLLGQLVGKLLDTDETLAPRSALFDLTDSLIEVLDEMQREGLSPDCLQDINVDDQSEHWRNSLRFLNILTEYWTTDDQDPDPEQKLRQLITDVSVQWDMAPPTDPILIVGSTGSRGSTALFMKAVANLPNGAVVLPGFDTATPAPVWEELCKTGATMDHPQAGFAKLMGYLGLEADDLKEWCNGVSVSETRNQLISLALRPAPITSQWMSEGPSLIPTLEEATKDITLLEAQSTRDEANAIALIMRDAVAEGRKIALVTPDRMLTRRVHAALMRWNITPDDSAGRPLPLTPPGVFLRLVLSALIQPLTPQLLVSTLKHPLCFSANQDRGDHMLRTRDLELQYLRGGPPDVAFQHMEDWAAKRLTDPQAILWIAKLRDIFLGLPLTKSRSVSDWATLHRQTAEALSNGFADDGGELWKEAAGLEALRVFEDLQAHAAFGGEMDAREYMALVQSVLNTGDVREAVTPHPDVAIWGTLEARVQWADVVVLGGLNEGIWPPKPTPDPWLNRAMRKQVGLPLPETKIGLSAHDFQQVAAAPKVVLSRSIRDGEAPTVASRWVIRLLNLLNGLGDVGQSCVSDMRDRGQVWTRLAHHLDRPKAALPKAERPRPKPPVASRPRALRLTQLRTLIRDPYAVYAREVLGLRPLDPLGKEPDALVRGIVLHKIMEEFTAYVSESWPDAPVDDFMRIAAEVLEKETPWPASRQLWQARLARIAQWHIAHERERQSRGRVVAQECSARVTIPELDFTLSAQADRIDIESDGQFAIYDYKSGSPPSKKQVELFDKQLPLEAALATRGDFDKLGKGFVSRLEYIGLGGQGTIQSVPVDAESVAKTWDEFKALIQSYDDPDQPYTARQKMEKMTDVSDYDHLSRFAEWSEAGDDA